MVLGIGIVVEREPPYLQGAVTIEVCERRGTYRVWGMEAYRFRPGTITVQRAQGLCSVHGSHLFLADFNPRVLCGPG